MLRLWGVRVLPLNEAQDSYVYIHILILVFIIIAISWISDNNVQI